MKFLRSLFAHFKFVSYLCRIKLENMKNFNIQSFILGGLVFVLMSATAIKTDLLTVKPATPKSVVVLTVTWATTASTKDEIYSYIKKGYNVKSTVSVDTRALIVMEKY